MTITLTTPEALAGIACPSWCTLGPDHGLSWHDDGRESREHRGPKFGPYMEGYAQEFTDAPGMLVHGIFFDLGAPVVEYLDTKRPGELLDLAAHSIAAAQWLEEHR